jgi:hypothetical protein
MAAPDTGMYVSLILNDLWMVRHYRRNRIRRNQAIRKLGEDLREALNNSADFHEILRAMYEGMNPKDDYPPF